MPFGTATGAFFIGTHHAASLAYPAGHEPVFGNGVAVANSMAMMIGALTFGPVAIYPLKADIGCVLDYRSVGDAAVTTTPVYARNTDWSSRIGLATANADACL